MQELAKYCLRSQFSNPESASERFFAVSRMADDWLSNKGVADLTKNKGSFASKNQGATGHYTNTLIQNDLGQLREIFLVDVIPNEHAFATVVKVGIVGNEVIAYCSMAVKRLSQIIAPIRTYPRCPRIIRELIENFDDWHLDSDPVPTAQILNMRRESGGVNLCNLLLDKNRKFPVVVVSDDPDERTWPNLAERLARDLAGVAHVAEVDAEGSWAITDALGKKNSCYLGAVRLYWPLGTRENLNTSVWTATTLSTEYGGDNQGANRFLSAVREIVLETSSLSLSPPKILREISIKETRRRISQANAEEQERELNTIIDENSSLSEELEEASAEIGRLKGKIKELYARLGENSPKEDVIQPDTEPTHAPAQPGDLRYYKKIGRKGDADELVLTKQCNHNSWRGAPKAPQAMKGLQRLENRSDWKTIQHCNGCTGGGSWRVQW